MTDSNVSNRSTRALPRPTLAASLSMIRSRRGLIALAALLLALGFASNWSWLVAVGVAPIILAVLPCAVMCAFGLCMSHGNHHSDSAADGSSSVAADAGAQAERSCCSPSKARSR